MQKAWSVVWKVAMIEKNTNLETLISTFKMGKAGFFLDTTLEHYRVWVHAGWVFGKILEFLGDFHWVFCKLS